LPKPPQTPPWKRGELEFKVPPKPHRNPPSTGRAASFSRKNCVGHIPQPLLRGRGGKNSSSEISERFKNINYSPFPCREGGWGVRS